MTWEQKLAALQALMPDTCLRMRKPGDWYVDARGRSIGGDGLLHGNYGNGKTPEAAIENDWLQMTEIPSDRYIVVQCGGERRQFRWSGFMWSEVKP